MDSLTLVLLGVMPALIIIGGIKDVTSMKIPNWISGLLILGFVPAALAVGLSPMVIAVHFGTALVALLFMMALFALRWIGGGDAKLFASACLWLGLSGSGLFLLWTAIAGGLLSLFILMARGWLRPWVSAAPGWVGQLMEPKGDIPYGVAIAAGALMAYPASPMIAAFIAG
jgi:prepilin peptidase CpaA